MKYWQGEGCRPAGVKYLMTGGGMQTYRCEILTDRWMGVDMQV